MSTLKSTLVHLAVVSALSITVLALLARRKRGGSTGKGLLAAGRDWIGLVQRDTFGVDAAIASAVAPPASGPTAGSGVVAKGVRGSSAAAIGARTALASATPACLVCRRRRH